MALTQFTIFENAHHIDLLANATVETITETASTLYGFWGDNSDNKEDSFVKFYDAAASPTVGTTAPVVVARLEAGKAQEIPFGNKGEGRAFTNKMYVACVTTGGKGGTTSPDEAVKLKIYTN